MQPVNQVRNARRGVTVVLVTVVMVALLGFAALTVDVGWMYNTRSDLQRTADSAAMAAAARLSEYENGDPASLARTTAIEYVRSNLVLNRQMELDSNTDITFYRSSYDAANNKFTFNPTAVLPDAVKVNVRMTGGSPNGALSLIFANVFGHASTDVSASATAMMIPRDIAIAADLSASHTDDSELRHYRNTEINLWDVWDSLPGGLGEVGSMWNPAAIPGSWVQPDGSTPQAAGPAWGFMETLGYGTQTVDASYNPTTDAGLVNLPYRQNWTNAQLTSFLSAQGYNAAERNAIMNNGAGDSSTTYPYRVSIALGLAYWNSGMSGGRWSLVGQPPGNNNVTIGVTEMVWGAENIMGRSTNDSRTIWLDYISNYAMATSTAMYDANSAFRYRYGVKTFTNYLLEDRPQNDQTPELVNTPTQPMQAVKDGVRHMMEVLTTLQTDDQVSLEVYGTTGRHEVDLTNDFYRVSDRLAEMQAAHYDRYTNMGAGIQRALEELTSPRARTSTRKIIVLYTDGVANVDASGNVNYAGAEAYALSKAQEAADRNFRIYAVSVGAEPNLAFMDQIAEIGHGQHYHAEGEIAEYSAELDQIFNSLGGNRPIQLVE